MSPSDALSLSLRPSIGDRTTVLPRRKAGAREAVPVGESEKPKKQLSTGNRSCQITDCFLDHRLVLF